MDIFLALDLKSVLSIKNYFIVQRGYNVVGLSLDGETTVASIIKAQPDVVLLDLVLPNLDGFSILEELQSINFINRPLVIMLSQLSNSYVKHKAKALGAVDFIEKPYSLADIHRRINSAMKVPRRIIHPGTDRDIEEQINAMCVELGMPTQLDGCIYLKYAIKISYENPLLMCNVVHKLYPAVAKCFGVSAYRVDIKMRQAINIVCDRRRTDIFNDIVGLELFDEWEHLSNSEFISTVVNKLQMVLGDKGI